MDYKQVCAHAYRPGGAYCKRCGCADFVHPHPASSCRPETCGGVEYDPCEWAVS